MTRICWVCFFALCSASVALADDGSYEGLGSQRLGAERSFSGDVTAVDVNGDHPGLCFTAVDADNQAKVFQISSLEDLDVGDRVVLKYRERDIYPQRVTTIRFLPPAEESGK